MSWQPASVTERTLIDLPSSGKRSQFALLNRLKVVHVRCVWNARGADLVTWRLFLCRRTKEGWATISGAVKQSIKQFGRRDLVQSVWMNSLTWTLRAQTLKRLENKGGKGDGCDEEVKRTGTVPTCLRVRIWSRASSAISMERRTMSRAVRKSPVTAATLRLTNSTASLSTAGESARRSWRIESICWKEYGRKHCRLIP